MCVCVFFIILLTYFDSKASTETYSKSRYRQRHRGLPSVFCSPKAVSKGGPNKPVVSSETGVCWLLRQKKQDNTEETVSSKQLQLQQSVQRLVACCLIRLQLPFPLKSSQQYYKCVIFKVWQEHKQRQEEWREKLLGWFWGQNKNNWLLEKVTVAQSHLQKIQIPHIHCTEAATNTPNTAAKQQPTNAHLNIKRPRLQRNRYENQVCTAWSLCRYSGRSAKDCLALEDSFCLELFKDMAKRSKATQRQFLLLHYFSCSMPLFKPAVNKQRKYWR